MTNKPWWQTTTVYQIYPRSYADSTGNGIGDLKGIISKLDYIKDLGFETIWFSPFYASPQGDFGYDISDYLDIAPEYGTVADAIQLIEEIHTRDMRVLFDMVMNHTSDQHAWFKESRSSRDNPKRDWYIWRDGKGRRPPNNWKAIPGGSGWHYDETTDQYYYASFLPFQPDLNFRNPEVKETMFDCVKFWLDHGVDGYRLDIFGSIYKDEQFRDNPFSPNLISIDENAGMFQSWDNTVNLPETADFAKELRAFVDDNAKSGQGMLIGEVFGAEEQVKRYLGDNDGLNLVFLWNLLPMKVEANFVREVINYYEDTYADPLMPIYVYGNHDQRRYPSKLKGDVANAKLMTLLQFTARGVPVTYYGEEIGMMDGDFPTKDALDPVGQRFKWLPTWLMIRLGLYVNRDGCRTPMQWNASSNAGFTTENAAPWLPVLADYAQVNVDIQQADENSLYTLYKRVIHLRNETSALHAGELFMLNRPETPDVVAYIRQHELESVLVALNFGDAEQKLRTTGGFTSPLLATSDDFIITDTSVTLPPKSGVVLTT